MSFVDDKWELPSNEDDKKEPMYQIIMMHKTCGAKWTKMVTHYEYHVSVQYCPTCNTNIGVTFLK